MANEITIFNELVKHKVEGVMFHIDMANIMDFMGLCGFKREHEYHALKEFADMRGIERYAINHINYMPNANGANRVVDVIPSGWYNANRFQVNESDRRNKVRELYSKWKDWECDTKCFLEKSFKELVEIGAIASANKVNKLIFDVDMELKHLEREMIEYNSIGYDMVYIMEKQQEMHDYYEDLTKEKIKVEMC